MIFTSYFGNYRNIPEGKKAISISLSPPQGINISNGEEFYPTPHLLRKYKAGSLSTWEYEKIYRDEVLSKLDVHQMYQKYNDAALLCYETPNDFCHRQIVSDWFKEGGYSIEELRPKISIAVVGSRGYGNYAVFSKLMDRLVGNYNKETVTLVSGGAKSGADHLVVRYAKERKLPLEEHLPDWGSGRGAGFARNETIWQHSHIGIAFWDGSSRGTAHSFEIAKRQKKKLYIVHCNNHHRIELRDHTSSSVRHGLF